MTTVESIEVPFQDETESLIFEDYVENKAVKSINTARAIRSAFGVFMRWWNRSVFHIKPGDALAYCKFLDSLDIKQAGKRANKNAVKKVVDAFLNWEGVQNNTDVRGNPFNVVKEYNFKEDPATTLAEDENAENKVYTLADIKAFLLTMRKKSQSTIRATQKCYFPLALLQVFCGTRLSEPSSLFLENLNLDKRYFKTGVVNGNRKSKNILVPFPETVAGFIREYLAQLRVKSKYVFPGADPARFFNLRNIRRAFESCGIKSHSFRHTMETMQKKAGVSVDDIEFLSNHALTGVVRKVYINYSPEDRVALYDKCLPPMYHEILEWLETL